ncbi:MAG: MerR family transcriptional regulator [Sphingobacteriales bacterium]|jgi:DNA-binding transcriptional MerR regulator|nr:MerR family transcriptional regulator [Sphingobacteriales bacterium]
MNSFTIKDLENLSGIKAHTLRIWEQRYNFLKPSRTFTNIRYYSNEELKTVLNIALLNKYGYKISHIDKMNSLEINDKILSLNQVQAQQERIINDLVKNMVDMDMEAFETTLGNYILARGIERTITQIIFGYMEKIGILWLTNHINPAQEHLVTNIIRQKLIVGIEGVSTSLRINKTLLLFLPEAEYHELGLLFMYYLLKSRGADVIYLGTNVPIKDVAYVVNLKKPDYLYSHITTPGQHFNFDKFLLNVSKELKTVPCIISGQLTQNYEKKIHPPILFKKTFSEVMEFISTL